MTPSTMRVHLKEHIKTVYGTQGKAALAWKCSQAYISDVISGKAVPNEVILTEIGLRKVRPLLYLEIETSNA